VVVKCRVKSSASHPPFCCGVILHFRCLTTVKSEIRMAQLLCITVQTLYVLYSVSIGYASIVLPYSVPTIIRIANGILDNVVSASLPLPLPLPPPWTLPLPFLCLLLGLALRRGRGQGRGLPCLAFPCLERDPPLRTPRIHPLRFAVTGLRFGLLSATSSTQPFIASPHLRFHE
jgi:hypothetical protein